ncbi:MAG TPA: AAA family ATPase [Chitinophagaceae bacterium]|nr:AAA family ATPase [Chitinophagaceae bacterium]
MLKKVVILGPESTGKSTLCEQLAQHFDTMWCPEFAREWLLTNGKNYSYDDLLTIAKGQLALEEEYSLMLENQSIPLLENGGHIPLFIDTDMYVMKVWCEFVFGQCHSYILEQIIRRKYDLYLLCNVDLIWTADELREYPDLKSRQTLYNMYKDCMINQDIPWVEISGDHEQRFQTAVKAVNKLL